jgi:hypothetical protein
MIACSWVIGKGGVIWWIKEVGFAVGQARCGHAMHWRLELGSSCSGGKGGRKSEVGLLECTYSICIFYV